MRLNLQDKIKCFPVNNTPQRNQLIYRPVKQLVLNIFKFRELQSFNILYVSLSLNQGPLIRVAS